MKKFTPEEDAFIVANANKFGCTQMARELTAAFGINRSHQSVSRRCKEVLKIKLTNNKRNQYTQEQKAFIKRVAALGVTIPQLTMIFNTHFKTSITRIAMQHICEREDVFPERKGLKMIAGKKNPFTPTLPIGSETVSAGKTYIKIADNVACSKESRFGDNGNWVQKNRYVYEQKYGKIPKGYLLVALDGNRNNFTPDNFYAVPRKIGMMLGANKWFSKDKEITLAAIKWCELFYALKAEDSRTNT